MVWYGMVWSFVSSKSVLHDINFSVAVTLQRSGVIVGADIMVDRLERKAAQSFGEQGVLAVVGWTGTVAASAAALGQLLGVA